MLQVTDLSLARSDGGGLLLSGISFTIAKGHIMGLCGFAGSGKTALVRCLTGLESGFSGEVRSEGGPVRLWQMPEGRDEDGTRRKAIDAALKTQGAGCGALVLDDPDAGLDPLEKRELLKGLRKLANDQGLPVLLVSSALGTLKAVCDDAAFLDAGELIEQGEALRVLGMPLRLRTREFVENSEGLGSFLQLLHQGRLPGAGDDPVWELTFLGDCAGEALVAQLMVHFQVSANIVYGSIDIIGGQIMGKLGVSLRGSPGNLLRAQNFLKVHGVEVTVRRGAIDSQQGQA